MFENDRDALHTSKTYKRMDIRECRDRVTLTCPSYFIDQFDIQNGYKTIESTNEWYIEQ